MEITLKQITNTLSNQPNQSNQLKHLTQSNFNDLKKQIKKDLSIRFPFKKLITIGSDYHDFGQCIPGTIHQKTITLELKEDLPEPVSFCMEIFCNDQQLDNLPQFVFAIKKDKQSDFTDCFRFRLARKGKYDFVLAVKTPNLTNYHVKSQLKIFSQFSDTSNQNQFYSVCLEQRACLPVIECSKQLICQKLMSGGKVMTPLRLLKFSQIKTKLKKQVRIPFKLQTDTKLTLINEVIGGLAQNREFESNLIEVNPKQLTMTAKGAFIVGFKLGFTKQMSQYLQQLQNKQNNQGDVVSYTMRRILVMRINGTNIYFHYPIQINFFLGNTKNQISIAD